MYFALNPYTKGYLIFFVFFQKQIEIFGLKVLAQRKAKRKTLFKPKSAKRLAVTLKTNCKVELFMHQLIRTQSA